MTQYTDGLTVHVCPAEVPEDIAKSMLDMAAKAHRLLGCKGASRSDFRWDDEAGEAGIYLLEINTQPGMTPLSLVPEQAKFRGISYGELVEWLIAEALGAPMMDVILREPAALMKRERRSDFPAERGKHRIEVQVIPSAQLLRHDPDDSPMLRAPHRKKQVKAISP